MAQLDIVYYLLSKSQLQTLLTEMVSKTQEYQAKDYKPHTAVNMAISDLLSELNNNDMVETE